LSGVELGVVVEVVVESVSVAAAFLCFFAEVELLSPFIVVPAVLDSPPLDGFLGAPVESVVPALPLIAPPLEPCFESEFCPLFEFCWSVLGLLPACATARPALSRTTEAV
jgi:hypothetical protein